MLVTLKVSTQHMTWLYMSVQWRTCTFCRENA